MSAVMFDLFKTVRVILKFDNVRIDNNVFRLHYKLSVILLVVFSLLVTSKQYFGDPIHCHLSKENGLNIDTYCWIFGTFTVKKHLKAGSGGNNYVQPGIGHNTKADDIISHKYYQWVCFVLALQAAMFYIPRHLWKTWEGGRLKMLAGDLGLPVVSMDWNESRKNILLQYLAVTNRNTHTLYALRFVVCEVLNFANVIGQIYLIDLFLGGTFSTYGPAVLKFSESGPEERVDPMAAIFPKVAKCTYRYVGPSGTTQVLDALCVLPLNILNEKIFMFLWFWFVVLASVSGLAVLFRFLLMYSTKMRRYLIMAQARHVKHMVIMKISTELNYGDWFILNMLGKNTNPIIFRELVSDFGNILLSDGKNKGDGATGKVV